MTITAIIDLKFPLDNPVLIFSLILFIILFSPILLNKFKIPHLIGLIIAGIIIGQYGLNLISRDESINLFGTVGLLYIMFIAGLEIDMNDFKKNIFKSIVFGLFTFSIPMIFGIFSGLYILRFSLITSILLASMYASNTLITYPIVSKLGVTKNRAVNITVGGTMITTVLALLVLAIIVGLTKDKIDHSFWINMIISLLVFGLAVMFLFPIIGRWFFKKYDDNISQYIFVLGMVFLGAFLAEVAGTEPIIGAFLAGLALNPLIPRTSPLMNRIDFVGNALFIPFFLIGVGMLIDLRIFFEDMNTIIVAVVMTTIATLSKYTAAWLTQKTFRFTRDERSLIFGLSNAQAASTLAAVLVGYNIILSYTAGGEPIRLLNDSVLNGTILMIIITCTIASFETQKGARNIALSETINADPDEEVKGEKILIPVNNPEYAEELINLSITVKSKNNRDGLFALNVIHNTSEDIAAEKQAKKILEKAVHTAAATDNIVFQLLRYDLNIINGISNVVKEHKITDIILGLHQKKGITDTFLGNLTGGILAKCPATVFIYRPSQPLATIKRNIIIVPDKAEKEAGFGFWLAKIWNIKRNTGSKLVFFASEQTIAVIKKVNSKYSVEAQFNLFADWDDFLILAKEIKPDDNFIIVLSRKNQISYQNSMDKIPSYLNKYFNSTNFILIYPPLRAGLEDEELNLKNLSVFEPTKNNIEKLDELGKSIKKLFGKN